MLKLIAEVFILKFRWPYPHWTTGILQLMTVTAYLFFPVKLLISSTSSCLYGVPSG
jgi:hypothetical protein